MFRTLVFSMVLAHIVIALVLSISLVGCSERFTPGIPHASKMIQDLESKYQESLKVEIIAETPTIDAHFFIITVEKETGSVNLRVSYFLIDNEWISFFEEIE